MILVSVAVIPVVLAVAAVLAAIVSAFTAVAAFGAISAVISASAVVIIPVIAVLFCDTVVRLAAALSVTSVIFIAAAIILSSAFFSLFPCFVLEKSEHFGRILRRKSDVGAVSLALLTSENGDVACGIVPEFLVIADLYENLGDLSEDVDSADLSPHSVIRRNIVAECGHSGVELLVGFLLVLEAAHESSADTAYLGGVE